MKLVLFAMFFSQNTEIYSKINDFIIEKICDNQRLKLGHSRDNILVY